MLYLASTSPSRKQLLIDAGIPFTVIAQAANEEIDEVGKTLAQFVMEVAERKWAHAREFMQGYDGQIAYLVVADTMTQGYEGSFFAKPIDRNDACRMLAILRTDYAIVGTGFIVEKMVFKGNAWHTIEKRVRVVEAKVFFKVPENEVDEYLHHTSALYCSGAMVIDGYGSRYIHSIVGSYTTVLGLPLYQLVDELAEMNFFQSDGNKDFISRNV